MKWTMLDGKTVIVSNGSKWVGQQPDSIDELCRVLEAYALDRTFENFGNFIFPPLAEDGHIYQHYGFTSHEGVWHFCGNFADVSHVFSIYTNEADVVQRLTEAILANQKRGDYLSQ